jgi:hypothetical protein
MSVAKGRVQARPLVSLSADMVLELAGRGRVR